MPRTIVYSQAAPQPRGGGGGAPTLEKGDGFTERLSKYIPAEVLAGFLPLIGLTGDREPLLWVSFVLGLAVTVLYLYVHALQQNDPRARPRPFFYLLAGISFAAWAIGTSDPVRGLFQLDDVSARFALAITAFALPAVDLAIDLRFPRKQ